MFDAKKTIVCEKSVSIFIFHLFYKNAKINENNNCLLIIILQNFNIGS